VLDRRLVEQVAADLLASPGLVEKDWHVTRAIGVLAALDHRGARPAFGGGTSLSKAWGLIKRFSEDIDFKVAMPPASSRNQAKKARSAYRDQVLAALATAGFTLAGEPMKRDENRFFSADLAYPSLFPTGPGLRPHIRVEMQLEPPVLAPIERPIGSLITQAQRQDDEVAAFPCVDPVETAADKLSALAWRVQARNRGSADDDPTIIRHLHDLAALETRAAASPEFVRLVQEAAARDADRGGRSTPDNPAGRRAMMLDRLDRESFWASDYEAFVQRVSFALPEEAVNFTEALAAVRRLVARLSG
jgi:hypothetical protein